MKILANIVWMIFGGLVLALLWAAVGLLFCITVVGIPFGVQCFKLARLSLFPYGQKVRLDFAKHPIANVIWAVLGGWEIAIVYLMAGLLNCITIIGIPRGLQCFKFVKLAFFPFGAKLGRH